MNEEVQRYIEELKAELSGQKDFETIVADYEAHIYEMIEHEDIEANKIYETLVDQLGTPREIAKVWKQETGITPRKTQWLFILLNIAIFVGGTVLLICFHVFGWSWLIWLWNTFVQIPIIFFLLFALFWALLGYEIGKEFGHRGKRLLQRTYLITLLPNIVIIYFILFTLLLDEELGSLFSIRAIAISLLCIVVLYPITFIGYYWGRKVSI